MLALSSSLLSPWLIKTVLFALVLAVVKHFTDQLNRRRSLPPVVFHWIPWIGSALAYGDDPLGFLNACRDKYGNVFTFVLFGRRVTVTLGVAGNNFVMGSHAQQALLSAEDAYASMTVPIFGKGVIYDCPRDIFMEQRKFLRDGLSKDAFRVYTGLIQEEVCQFVDKMMQKDAAHRFVEPLHFINELTLLTASGSLQGPELRAVIREDFGQVYHDLEGGFTPLHWLFRDLPLDSYRKRDAAHVALRQLYLDVIKKRRLDESKTTHSDMISSLMKCKYRTGVSLTDDEIAHLMIALLMAGQHTSAATASWIFIHLANNPDIARLLYEEQVDHYMNVDGSWGPLSYPAVIELPVLSSIVRETLRLHPPGYNTLRVVRDDIVIPTDVGTAPGGEPYVVPKGNMVLASHLLTQLDTSFWKKPMEWRPERWFETDKDSPRLGNDVNSFHGDSQYATSHGAYNPFGMGSHHCIGDQFATMQLSTIFATLIRHLNWKLEGDLPKPNYKIMIPVPHECRVTYEARSASLATR